MYRISKFVTAGTIFLQIAALVPEADAQTPPFTQAASPQAVTVPFEPPLDQPVRYRRRQVNTTDERTDSSWTIIEYTFSRRPGGYRLQVRVLDAGMDGGTAHAQWRYRDLMLRVLLPHVLLLDEEGRIVGLEDQDAFLAETVRQAEALVRQARDPAAPSQEQSMTLAAELVRDMPIEARLVGIAEPVSPVINFASTDFTLGQTLEREQFLMGMFAPPVRQQVSVMPERVNDGHLLIEVRGSVPRGEIVRQFAGLLSLLPVTEGSSTTADRAQWLARLRASRITWETEAHYEVALDTGLTRHYRSVDRVELGTELGIPNQISTIVTERVD